MCLGRLLLGNVDPPPPLGLYVETLRPGVVELSRELPKRLHGVYPTATKSEEVARESPT